MPIGDLFYIAYLTLILLIIFCNWIVLALVLRNLSKQTAINKNQKTEWMSRARIAIGCSILMGLTWTIGLFAVVKPLFTLKLLFCIVNSLQGFFICVFYCLRNKDARREWLKFCGYQGNKYRNSEDKSKKNIVGMANAGIVDDVYVRQ